MSTFGILVMLIFMLIFGVQIFLYCIDVDMPRLSGLMTLTLYLLLIAELVLALFEFPAKLIDGIVYISMGHSSLATGCGIVVACLLVFAFVMLYPKINWQKIMTSSPIKYIVLGVLITGLMAYTEVFNGSYSFLSLDEYFEFKESFSQYDNHFWPTKYIRDTEDSGDKIVVTYSVYPWDVSLTSGNQFAYKVITFYQEDESDGEYKLFYYPFTYNLYIGVDAVAIDYDPNNVSDSDIAS